MDCLTKGDKVEIKPVFEVSKNRYRMIHAILDSGASESVMPPGILTDYPKAEGKAFQDSVKYTTADGGIIPNQGERLISFFSREQTPCKVRFQITDVKRPLLAVSALTASGHTVEFNDDGGKVRLTNGKEIGFIKQNGVYLLEMWVPPF